MNATEERVTGRWTWLKRDIGTVLWISFLAASFGSLIIFALVDPRAMTDAMLGKWDLGRKWGYTLGFGFLWMVSLVASSLTIYMIRTGPSSGYSTGADPDRPVIKIKPGEQGAPVLKGGKVIGHDETE